MAHDFRTRSALHDFMFLSELQLDSYHDENRAEETRAGQEDEFGSRPLADREVGDQGDPGECEACSSDIHTGRARRPHVFPQYHVHRNETELAQPSLRPQASPALQGARPTNLCTTQWGRPG
jgi:hypothetical protein